VFRIEKQERVDDGIDRQIGHGIEAREAVFRIDVHPLASCFFRRCPVW
jgi:hypothetical protein